MRAELERLRAELERLRPLGAAIDEERHRRFVPLG